MLSHASDLSGNSVSGKLWHLAFWRRPRSYWNVVVFHLPLALIFGGALLLPHAVPLNKVPLASCTFLGLTGYPCPLCGFTRSFWAIAQGRWAEAMVNCPLAYLVYLFVVAMAVWHITALAFNVILSRGPMLQLKQAYYRKIVISIICLFMLNWLYRLITGLT